MALPTHVDSCENGSAAGIGMKGATGNLTFTTGAEIPSGHAVDDVIILSVHSLGSDPEPTLSGGSGFDSWTRIMGRVQTVRLTSWYARITTTAALTLPTVVDCGDHQIGTWTIVRGCKPGVPWVDAPFSDTLAAASVNISVPLGSSTVADTYVVVVTAADGPDSNTTNVQFDSWADASLSSVTERAAGSLSTGSGGAMAIVTGGKAAAGSLGTLTATQDTSAVRVYHVIPLTATTPAAGDIGMSMVI